MRKRLAERTGKSPGYVSDVCNEKQAPSDDFLRRAAAVLLVPEEWLHTPHPDDEPVPLQAPGVTSATQLAPQPEPFRAEAAPEPVPLPDPTELAAGHTVSSYDPDALPVPIPYGLLELKRHLGDAVTDEEFAYLYGFVDPTVTDRGAQHADRWDVDQWFKVLRNYRDQRLRRGPGGQ